MKQVISRYQTIIEKDGAQYHGFVPSLPGCHTQGKTVAQTKDNLHEAIAGYIMTMREEGEAVPQEDGGESIELLDLKAILPKTQHPQYA